VSSDDEQTIGVLVPLPVSQDPGNMGHHQLDDDQIRPVYLAVQNGRQPPLDVTKSWSRESRLLLQQWESLHIKKGILWRRRLGGKETDLQLVLPTEFHADVLRSLHEGATSAHLGVEKMLELLKERFYWPVSRNRLSPQKFIPRIIYSGIDYPPRINYSGISLSSLGID
jgi:hypothetical protein